MNEENNVRKSALMYNHGIGGLWTNNSDETFIIKAPKLWKWDNGPRGIIVEENLRRYLNVKTILFPPGAKDKQIPLINGSVAIGRFPGWHRCKGWRTLEGGKKEQCGAMVRLEQEDYLPICSEKNCSGRSAKVSTFSPVRFMVICSNNHLDDFPFDQWVHNDEKSKNHKLRYLTSSISGLAGILIKCETCSSEGSSVQRSMRGALSPESFSQREIKCTGRSPWLNNNKTAPCDCETLTGVQKSSSNLLFPIVRNSIYCPTNEKLPTWIKDWIDSDGRRTTILNLLPRFSTSNPLLEVVKIFGANLGEEKLAELEDNIDGISEYLNPKPSEDPFEQNGYQGIFQREYDRFLNFPESRKLDDFSITRHSSLEYSGHLRSHLKSIGLLEKLRDTRVYAGFSRIHPSNEVNVDTIRDCYGTDEVVGDIVRGEGIFLEFDQNKLAQWAAKQEVQKRVNTLSDQKKQQLLNLQFIDSIFHAAKYLLLHSFSHALIGEIAIYSGYNTASIRERIYIGKDGHSSEMSGILIYTSDGDSEGSLGGLVRLGKPTVLEKIVDQALVRATWCSSDPLCSHSIPKGTNGSNLAACHHCLLLPETCCETRNEYLDREFLISLNEPSLGYFTT